MRPLRLAALLAFAATCASLGAPAGLASPHQGAPAGQSSPAASASGGATSGPKESPPVASGGQSEVWRARWVKQYWRREAARKRRLRSASAGGRISRRAAARRRPARAPYRPRQVRRRAVAVRAAPVSHLAPKFQPARSAYVPGQSLQQPAASPEKAAAPSAIAHAAPPQPVASAQGKSAALSTNSAGKPGPAQGQPNSAPKGPAGTAKAATAPSHPLTPSPSPAPAPALSETRPDILAPTEAGRDHTIDNPMQAVGDGWKMVAYLVPTLVFVLVCLNLLRRYQEKTGRLPGAIRPAARTAAPPKQTVAAALAALFANKGGGRAGPAATEIRLLETLNIGTAALHLVEVRGKTLLLGVTPGGVSLLKDFTEHEGADSTDFRQILKSAAADLDELDLPNSKLPVNAVVDSLEDAMRDTADAMERRLRRLRKAQETEGGGL